MFDRVKCAVLAALECRRCIRANHTDRDGSSREEAQTRALAREEEALVFVRAVSGLVYGAVTWPVLAQLRRRAAPATRATRDDSTMASTDGVRPGNDGRAPS